jgi:hypothetical protein
MLLVLLLTSYCPSLTLLALKRRVFGTQIALHVAAAIKISSAV